MALKGRLVCFSVLLLLALCLCCTACADLSFYVTAEPQTGDVMPQNAVSVQLKEASGTYYLFLPASIDPKALYIYCGESALRIGGKNIVSGQQTSLNANGYAVTCTQDRKQHKLYVYRSKNLPAVFITTESGNLDFLRLAKANREAGTLYMQDASGIELCSTDLEYIKRRGNSSLNWPKNSYQFKMDDAFGLLGMDKCKKWLLRGSYYDCSLLRERITLDLARAAGLAYTPECKSVDLYINHVYEGSYLLSEKAEVDDARVNLFPLEDYTQAMNDLPLSQYPLAGTLEYVPGSYRYYDIPNDPPDITGGYLVEMDFDFRYGVNPDHGGFVTDRGQAFNIRYPEYPTQQQVLYLRKIIQTLENAVFAPDGVDPETGLHYFQMMDEASFVSRYTLEEVSKNYDAFRSSFYFYKPDDSVSTLLFAGPAWDYDNTYGCFFEFEDDVITPGGFIAQRISKPEYIWTVPLWSHEDFQEKVEQAYKTLYRDNCNVLLGKGTDPQGIVKSISEYKDEIKASANMNFALRKNFNTTKRGAKTGKSFDENITYLRSFIKNRVAYFERQWGK